MVETEVTINQRTKAKKSGVGVKVKYTGETTTKKESYHARCGTPVEKDLLPVVRKKKTEKKRSEPVPPPPPAPPLPPPVLNTSFSPRSRDLNETGYSSMLDVSSGSLERKGENFFQNLLAEEGRLSRSSLASPRQGRRCVSLDVDKPEPHLTGYSLNKKPVSESPFKEKYALKRAQSVSVAKSSHPDVFYVRSDVPRSSRLVKQAASKNRRESFENQRTSPRKPEQPNMSILASLAPHEYHRYIFELFHSSQKSDKFQRLKKFYAALEKVACLEKTATNAVLLHLARENLIDFDNWKQFRATQRAKSELDDLKSQLDAAQKERNFLYK
jgi:hypothetical protein